MPPSLFFVFRIVLASQGSLRFHVNFNIFSLIIFKYCHWDFDRDCIESIDPLE